MEVTGNFYNGIFCDHVLNRAYSYLKKSKNCSKVHINDIWMEKLPGQIELQPSSRYDHRKSCQNNLKVIFVKLKMHQKV